MVGSEHSVAPVGPKVLQALTGNGRTRPFLRTGGSQKPGQLQKQWGRGIGQQAFPTVGNGNRSLQNLPHRFFDPLPFGDQWTAASLPSSLWHPLTLGGCRHICAVTAMVALPPTRLRNIKSGVRRTACRPVWALFLLGQPLGGRLSKQSKWVAVGAKISQKWKGQRPIVGLLGRKTPTKSKCVDANQSFKCPIKCRGSQSGF